MLDEAARVGGLLFLLSILHFIVDWGFQTHKEAMQKATNHLVRARHCTIYTLGMLLCIARWDTSWVFLAATILWVSHFLIDTYVPVYLWVKYLRKPPEMSKPQASELERFKAFAQTPIGLFLVIAMDQAWHILFLIPLSCLLLYPEQTPLIAEFSGGALAVLFILVIFGATRLKT